MNHGKNGLSKGINTHDCMQSAHENRIYTLKLHCGPNYPDAPPEVTFISKVNLPCVDQRSGKVDPMRLPCLMQWKREFNMETVLIELRRYAI